MNISKAVEAVFNKYLPSPFTIAVLLTIVTIFLALFFTKPDTIGFVGYTVDILQYWEKGIWSSSLLEFAYQTIKFNSESSYLFCIKRNQLLNAIQIYWKEDNLMNIKFQIVMIIAIAARESPANCIIHT